MKTAAQSPLYSALCFLPSGETVTVLAALAAGYAIAPAGSKPAAPPARTGTLAAKPRERNLNAHTEIMEMLGQPKRTRAEREPAERAAEFAELIEYLKDPDASGIGSAAAALAACARTSAGLGTDQEQSDATQVLASMRLAGVEPEAATASPVRRGRPCEPGRGQAPSQFRHYFRPQPS